MWIEGWELQVVLLVWLSIVVLTPFALATIDTSAGEETSRTQNVEPPPLRLEARLVAVRNFINE